MGEAGYTKLDGSPKRSGCKNWEYNEPTRKQYRNHLYELICEDVIRCKKNMTKYDIHAVLNLVKRKVKEGKL